MVVNTLSAMTTKNNRMIAALALLLLRLFQYNNFALNSVFNLVTASFIITPCLGIRAQQHLTITQLLKRGL